MALRLNGTGPRHTSERAGRARRMLRLLYPGIGLKRWALLGAIGIAICSLGIAYWIRRVSGLYFPDFLPWYLEGFLLMGVGGFAILAAMYGTHRTLSPLVFRDQSIDALTEAVYSRWLGNRDRGPKVVAIGGGTGLSVLLRGLKSRTDNLTAIVTVADDGGSSGMLRRDLGMLPPGDLRSCLLAMSDDESLLTELFQYRFDRGNGLKGHSFGNLFIAAMTNMTGSFEKALIESTRVLAVRGTVIPATSYSLHLSASLEDGRVVRGESSITQSGGRIERLMIDPDGAYAHPMAIRAIDEADIVVIGPGSLYTSIIPNMLVRGIAESIRSTSAATVYVCNVATQMGETDGYTIGDHLKALQRHTSEDIADYVLGNDSPVEIGDEFDSEPVAHDGEHLNHAKLLLTDLSDDANPLRHNSDKLADAVMRILDSTPPHANGSRQTAAPNGSQCQTAVKRTNG